MDYKEQESDKSDLEYDGSKVSNSYKVLAKKLKSIREIINLLEKNFQ